MAAEVIDVHAHVVFEALNNTAGNYGPEAGVDQTGAPFFRIGSYTIQHTHRVLSSTVIEGLLIKQFLRWVSRYAFSV